MKEIRDTMTEAGHSGRSIPLPGLRAARQKAGLTQSELAEQRAGRASQGGPGDRAPARNLGERRLPTYVAEISYGARGDARASRGRSPPGVNGTAAPSRRGPRTNPPQSACKSTSKEIVL
jgi:hypothetical protein